MQEPKPVLFTPWSLNQAANPRFVERFRAEARAAAGLRHPAIVAIHEIGEHEGQPWFTMDYVAGPSLAGRGRRTDLDCCRDPDPLRS